MKNLSWEVVRLTGLSLLFLGTLGACDPGRGAGRDLVPDRKSTLTFLYPAEPVTLDPSASLDVYSGIVLDHAFERLVRIGPTGEVQPAAAQSWTLSPDGKVYTFTLRTGALWSDGKPVVAADFRNAWLRVLDPRGKGLGTASNMTPYILGADAYSQGLVGPEKVGLSAPDDHTFVVVLKAPAPFFLPLITSWCFSPLRLDVINRAGPGWDKNPATFLSNGPYRMADYQKGAFALLVRNPGYWNLKAIAIPAIKVLFQQKDQDPYQMFRDGDLDCVFNVRANEVKNLPDLQPNLHIDPTLGTSMVFVNHRNPTLNDLRFREALARTVDRDRIVRDAVQGAGTPSRFFVPSSLRMAGENFHEFTDLNPPADNRNLPGGPRVSLRLYYRIGGENARTAEILAADWNRTLGIEVIPTGLAWGDLFARCRQGDYDLALMAYSALYPHPMAFVGLFLEGGTASEISGWNDRAFQQKIRDSLMVQDEKVALGTLRGLEATILDGAHIIPLYQMKVICLMADRVTGWYRNGLSNFNFEAASLR